IRSCATPEPMIGGEHLDVNFGGYRGYGGKCLPKDVRALLQFSRQAGVALPVLEAAEEYNNALLLAQGRAEAIPENQMDKDR
ncbi:MAG: hypothetical protein HW383_172, partial [Candidatus Magasanikbacteria bacterium]|nr:hypothetical protein [Candidatus Magasanikbacteria bacterium]